MRIPTQTRDSDSDSELGLVILALTLSRSRNSNSLQNFDKSAFLSITSFIINKIKKNTEMRKTKLKNNQKSHVIFLPRSILR